MNVSPDMQIVYDPAVVAHLFGVSRMTICHLCRTGQIPTVNLGSFSRPRWRIPLSFIEGAYRGEARWKYPKVLKRQQLKHSRQMTLTKITRANEEVANLARKEREWEDENDE